MKQRVVWRYLVYGALFGLLFPILSAWIWMALEGWPISFASVLRVHQENELQFIIDTAPFFLGLFAALGGLRQARVLALNHELSRRIKEREELVAELEKIKDALEGSLQKQLVELKAAAQVARDSASLRQLDELLDRIVHMISENFGFYHAGIFLLDEAGEYAVLRAANSPGGQKMLARGHRLKVGPEGIVGTAASLGEPRLAMDVEQDAVFWHNPDLPETRCEIGLPLKLGGAVIGVLDVQSTEIAAITREDLEILQVLADQLAIAIENARLLRSSQRSYQELEALVGKQVRDNWDKLLSRRSLSYRYNGVDVTACREPTREALQNTTSRQDGVNAEGSWLSLPIQLKGQKIGSLQLKREVDRPWTGAEQELARTALAQIALALENARLIEESQRRASNERLAGQITRKMRETLNIETVLQTAAKEMRRALNLAEAEIRLGIPVEEGTQFENNTPGGQA